jgi:hypothetical protein
MGCNCKTNNLNLETKDNNVTKNKVSLDSFKQRLTNIIYFILVLIIGLPFINLFFIWFLFKTVVIKQNIDITNLLVIVAKKLNMKLKDEDEDEDDDELEILTENDVELLEVEDITDNKEIK